MGFINDAGSNSLPHQGDNNSISTKFHHHEKYLNMPMCLMACVAIGYRLTSSTGNPSNGNNNSIGSVEELESGGLLGSSDASIVSTPSSSMKGGNNNTKARTENTPRISKPKKQTRRVHFAESVHDVQIIPRKTADENAAAWYTKLDIALFKLGEREDATLLRYIIASTNSLDELLTKESASIYRGLERLLSSQIVAEINKRRLFVVKSVILEQALQRRYLKTDVLRIAKVSKKYSEKATLWARTLGSLL